MMSHFKSQGFTLVELLIVMVIIGLASSFVLPTMWQQFDQAKFYSERKQLVSAINYAKQYTVYKGAKLKLELYQNSIEIIELDKVTSYKQADADYSAADEIEQQEEGANDEGTQQQNKVLKKITFESLILEPVSYELSANRYFKPVSIKLSVKDKDRNEIIEI